MRKWTLQSRKGCNRWFQIEPIPEIPIEPERVVVVSCADLVARLREIKRVISIICEEDIFEIDQLITELERADEA